MLLLIVLLMFYIDVMHDVVYVIDVGIEVNVGVINVQFCPLTILSSQTSVAIMLGIIIINIIISISFLVIFHLFSFIPIFALFLLNGSFPVDSNRWDQRESMGH
jgi:hypothetical protein